MIKLPRKNRTCSLRIPKMPYPLSSQIKVSSALPKLSASKNLSDSCLSDTEIRPKSSITDELSNISSRCSTKNFNGEPLVDNEIPKVISLSSNRHILQGEINIPSLPMLPSPKNSSFNGVFKEKINVCNFIFNFSQPQLQVKGKKEKSAALNELIVLLSNTTESSLISIENQDLLLEMIMKNILEQDPFTSVEKIFACSLKSKFVERSWEHISLIYKVLNQFVLIYPKKFNLDHTKKAIRLMNIPDPNERENLVTFLKNYTKVHPEDFEEILKQIGTALTNVRYDIYTPYCIDPIISYMAIMFMACSQPVIKSHLNNILYTHLLPLFRHERLSLYYCKLNNLITSIVDNSHKDQLNVIIYLIKHFPYQCGQKQPLFVSSLISIIKTMKGHHLNPIALKLFIFIAMAVKSPNSKLAESALTLLSKPNMKPIILSNYNLAMDYLYEPLRWSSNFHWDRSIKDQSQSAIMTLLNAKVEVQKNNAMCDFLQSSEQQIQDENKKLDDKELIKIWAGFSRTAARRYKTFDLTQSLIDIQVEFTRDQKNKELQQSPKIVPHSESGKYKSSPLKMSINSPNVKSQSLRTNNMNYA